jgi:hypothetical protein
MESEMERSLDALPERVNTIERKLDGLSASVDKRFDEVSEQFAEQRQYTEFVFQRLQDEMRAGFGRVDRRLDQLDGKVDLIITILRPPQ